MCCYNCKEKTCPGVERNREAYGGMREGKAGKENGEGGGLWGWFPPLGGRF